MFLLFSLLCWFISTQTRKGKIFLAIFVRKVLKLPTCFFRTFSIVFKHLTPLEVRSPQTYSVGHIRLKSMDSNTILLTSTCYVSNYFKIRHRTPTLPNAAMISNQNGKTCTCNGPEIALARRCRS